MRATAEELECLNHNTTYNRLLCLNDIKARLYLPVTVFLALLIIVGTIGNTTVCLVYWKRKSRSSSHYFILSLAALDLVTCVIGMPTEIADLVLPYTFESPLACKVLRFTHSSTIIASSTILIQVAFDRYYRICQLGRQFTSNKARMLCVSAVFLGFVCSWPTFLLFGRKTVTRNLNGQVLKGTDCSTDDSMRRTIFPTIYYIFLFSLFGVTVMFFVVLYSKIGLTILRRKRFTTGSSGSSSQGGKSVSRSGSKKIPISEPPSSDLSSGQDNAHNHSTASSNSNASASSNISTLTTATSISTILYGSFRRSYSKQMKQADGTSQDSLQTSSQIEASQDAVTDHRAYGGGESHSIDIATISHNIAYPKISSTNDTKVPRKYIKPGSAADTQENYLSKDSQHGKFIHEIQSHKLYGLNDCHVPCPSDDESAPAHKYYHQAKEQPTQRSSQRQIRAGKTTTVLFAVTLAYILSFFPYLTVMVMRSIIKDLEENLSPVGELAYKLCVKSFFINNAINPLIYSFLNQSFRQDAKQMLKKSCCRSKSRDCPR